MEITEVKVFPIQEEKLKAFVSIVFDQCFMVNDIKIIQGRDGLFISMPSRKKKNGEFKDVAHPLNNETRRMIEGRSWRSTSASSRSGARSRCGERRCRRAAMRRRRWRRWQRAVPHGGGGGRSAGAPREATWRRSRRCTSATPSGP